MQLSNASKTIVRIVERERQENNTFAFMRLSLMFPELTNTQIQRLMKSQAELEISDNGDITYTEVTPA
jgi:hypothetical protein